MLLYKHFLETDTNKCIVEEINTRESPKFYIIDVELPYTAHKLYRNGKYAAHYTKRIPKDGLDVLTIHDQMFSAKPNKQLFCQLMVQRLNHHIQKLQTQEDNDRKLIQQLQHDIAVDVADASESVT